MAHRTTATLRRPPPHHYRHDPDTRVCRCGLPKRNQLHDEAKVAAYERDQEYHRQQIAQGQEWHRHRTGEHD